MPSACMQRTSIEYRISVNFNEELGYSYKLESYISVIENERLENFSARLDVRNDF